MTDPQVLLELLKYDIDAHDEVSFVSTRSNGVEFSINDGYDGVPPELMEHFAHRNARLVVGSEVGNYSAVVQE